MCVILVYINSFHSIWSCKQSGSAAWCLFKWFSFPVLLLCTALLHVDPIIVGTDPHVFKRCNQFVGQFEVNKLSLFPYLRTFVRNVATYSAHDTSFRP